MARMPSRLMGSQLDLEGTGEGTYVMCLYTLGARKTSIPVNVSFTIWLCMLYTYQNCRLIRCPVLHASKTYAVQTPNTDAMLIVSSLNVFFALTVVSFSVKTYLKLSYCVLYDCAPRYHYCNDLLPIFIHINPCKQE